MPTSRYNGGTTKRARFASKRKPNRRTTKSQPTKVIVPYSISNGAFPLRLENTTRYSAITSVSMSGGYGSYKYSTNGLFDVDITGTGRQPLYFDQLIAIYNHYTVTKSKIKVTVLPTGSTDLPPMVFSLWIDDDTQAVPENGALFERSGTKNKVVSKASTDNSLISYWNAERFFGPGAETNPNLRGTATANPFELSAFVFSLYSQDLINDTQRVLVELEYTATWEELTTMSTS